MAHGITGSHDTTLWRGTNRVAMRHRVGCCITVANCIRRRDVESHACDPDSPEIPMTCAFAQSATSSPLSAPACSPFASVVWRTDSLFGTSHAAPTTAVAGHQTPTGRLDDQLRERDEGLQGRHC